MKQYFLPLTLAITACSNISQNTKSSAINVEGYALGACNNKNGFLAEEGYYHENVGDESGQGIYRSYSCMDLCERLQHFNLESRNGMNQARDVIRELPFHLQSGARARITTPFTVRFEREGRKFDENQVRDDGPKQYFPFEGSPRVMCMAASVSLSYLRSNLGE